MKCTECGHRANSLWGMMKHWKQKHPVLLAKRKAAGRAAKRASKAAGSNAPVRAPSSNPSPAATMSQHYCPVCGRLH